jgi:hypothetical protein
MQLLGHYGGAWACGCRKKDGKLFTSIAGDNVACAWECAMQSASNLNEIVVSPHMAKRVIQLFEEIYVNHQDRDWLRIAAGDAALDTDPSIEGAPVWYSGEDVYIDELFQRSFGGNESLFGLNAPTLREHVEGAVKDDSQDDGRRTDIKVGAGNGYSQEKQTKTKEDGAAGAHHADDATRAAGKSREKTRRSGNQHQKQKVWS